jgi:hypothetical protein
MPQERSGYNNLTVEVYNAYSTTPVIDTGDDLRNATGLTLDTFYPGGVFGPCQLTLPRDVFKAWPFRQGQRLLIRNGLAVCWEGAIVNPGLMTDPNTMGRVINGAGYWGQLLGLQGWRRPWADVRITPDVWVEQTAATAYNLTQLSRQSQLKYTPKAVGWTNGVYAAVRFTAPTGMTIKRVKWTWQMAGTNWNTALYNGTTSANEVLITSNGGPTARDDTLGTPAAWVELRQIITASRTPAADGTEYVNFTNITVYCGGSADVTATQIVLDWAGHLPNMNADVSNVATNTLALVPWLTGTLSCDYEMASANLARLASLGDSNFAPWAAFVVESEAAATYDGKPIMAYRPYLGLTDYEYTVRLDDLSLGNLGLNETDVYNWIAVSYRDLNGSINWVTPDDDVGLKDTTSISTYNQHEKVLTGNFTSQAAALNYGKRFLASNKDKHYYVSRPIPVVGYITGKQGNPVPASQIRAGRRINIANILTDEIGLSGAGLTFTITGTHYDDASETCQISTGIPDNTAVLMARLAQGLL